MRRLVLGLIASGPVFWAGLADGPGGFSPAEMVTVLVVLTAAVLLVRARPATALTLAVVVWQITYLTRAGIDKTVGVVAAAGMLIAVAFLAGREAVDGRRGAGVLAVGTLSALVGGLVTAGAVDTAVSATVGTLGLAVVPWSVGRYRREYAAMVRAGWKRAEQLEREAELIAARAMARERARLAGEMHDLVGHALAHVALRIGALEVDPTLAAAHRESAREARAGVTEAAERLADAVAVLRSERSDRAEPVAELVARLRTAGLAIDLTETGEAADPIIEETTHRLVAEALTNVVKHAPGAATEVAVDRGNAGVRVRVSNRPGRAPAAPTPSGGHGLLGLQERVRLVGGRFTAERATDGGFAVVASLPRSPSRPVPPWSSASRSSLERGEVQVRRSARRAVVAGVAVSAATATAVAGFMLFDAATSVLAPDDFARLVVGQEESSVAAVLPWRTRVQDPAGAPPPPVGATCRFYSTHGNPFDEDGRDLHRLCFRAGRLVAKDLVVRARMIP